MSYAISVSELENFFNQFCEAFATFDGELVAEHFIAPGIALKYDGSLEGFTVQKDIVSYYQSALDYYKEAGCSVCKWSELDIHRLNDTSLTATASWDLLHKDGHVIRHWRQAYFISQFDGKIRIYGSAFVSS